MRKRSEISKPPKTPATVRTVPIAFDDPTAAVRCDLCEAEGTVGECTKNDKGELECPACGATPVALKPVALSSFDANAEDDPLPRHDTKRRADAAIPKIEITDEVIPAGPPKTYCAVCATELAIVNGKIWFNCGHREQDGIMRGLAAPNVDTPTKAERHAPVAGSARATILGRTLNVTRGKHTFPTVAYGSFHVGPFSASAELSPDADLVKTANEMRKALKTIADEAFDEEVAWYEQKLRSLKDQ
jgi:hypothetical protein